MNESKKAQETRNRMSSIDIFPLRHTLKRYNKDKFRGDIQAGISVAMLSFSMSIAYAMIAGLPVYYGLFGCVIAALVSCVFSSSRYIMFGPSNASAIMLISAFASLGLNTMEERMGVAAALVVLVGIFLILASTLKITNFIRYVSRTVISAYITAGALMIIAKQSGEVFGFSSNSSPRFYDTVKHFIQNLPYANFEALGVALLTLFIFAACKKFFKKLPSQAVALVMASVLCFAFKNILNLELKYIDPVLVSEWKLTLPHIDNVPLRDLIFASMALALFCIIESNSIGKSLAAKNADRLNTNQEIFSLGVANFAAGLFSGTVESGSMTRSAAGAEAGGKTTLVNLYCGIFMLMGIFILGSLVAYIPVAALSAIIIAVAIPLFSRSALRVAICSTRADSVVFFLTFFTAVIWSLEDSIYVGVFVSIMLFLKKASKPEVIEVAIGDDGFERRINKPEMRSVPEISIVHVGGNMFFGASEVFQNQIRRICEEPNLKVIVLKLGNAINFDGSSASDLGEIATQMKRRGGILYLCETSPEIISVLKKSGMAKIIGEDNIFPYTNENPTLSAAQALRAAKEFLGGDSGNVKIFV